MKKQHYLLRKNHYRTIGLLKLFHPDISEFKHSVMSQKGDMSFLIQQCFGDLILRHVFEYLLNIRIQDGASV